MNRSWATVRDRYSEELGEGSQRAHQLAQLLAEVADAEFIQSIINAKTAADQFGGQMFVAAKREKFDAEGHPTTSVGTFETVGYVFHFGHKVTAIHNAVPEPDAPFPVELPEANGTPESVEA